MAHSPTPKSATLPGMANTGRVNTHYHLSPTPPQHHPLNKRDKRRIAMVDRLTEISNNFAENRDAIYRKRLQGYQADITFINNANLYDNKPLNDFGDDPAANTSPALSVQGSVRSTQQGISNGHMRIDQPMETGKHAARFVQEVNDALEQKDADLTAAACHYNFSIDQLDKDYKYSVAVALEEHKRLTESIRQRLIQGVQAKRAALHRDKEKLDIADTNALLLHPTQLSINNAASPGGPQSNRKTRHTRHRLEVEDLEANSNINNSRRKRKAAADPENGSPSRDPEPMNGFKATETRTEYHQVTPPLYTIDRLFSERELNNQLQQASYDVLHSFSTKQRKIDPTSALLTAEPTDLEDNTTNADLALGIDGGNDDVFLAAPEMERSTTNQSYHATRSTRNLNVAIGASRENLGELAGRQTAAELIGSFQREKKTANDDYNRAPPVSEQEGAEDLALMAKAMKEEEEKKADEGLLDEVAGEKKNWVGDGGKMGVEDEEAL